MTGVFYDAFHGKLFTIKGIVQTVIEMDIPFALQKKMARGISSTKMEEKFPNRNIRTQILFTMDMQSSLKAGNVV